MTELLLLSTTGSRRTMLMLLIGPYWRSCSAVLATPGADGCEAGWSCVTFTTSMVTVGDGGAGGSLAVFSIALVAILTVLADLGAADA